MKCPLCKTNIFAPNMYSGNYLYNTDYRILLKENFSHVLELPFEMLKKQPEKFVSKICDFIGVDKPDNIDYNPVNIKIEESTLNHWRLFNKLFYSRYCNHKGLFPEYLNPLRYYQLLINNKEFIKKSKICMRV